MILTNMTGTLNIRDTHFSDMVSTIRCRTPGDEMELDIWMVQTSVGELGGHPGQALKGLRVSK